MTIPTETRPVKRIAIIGAGASGLAQAVQILSAFNINVNAESSTAPSHSHSDSGSKSYCPYRLHLTIYESRPKLGGVWLESPDAGGYKIKYSHDGKTRVLGLQGEGAGPSPIYAGLRTNLPKQLMSFRTHPFPDSPLPLTPHPDTSSLDLFPRASEVLAYLEDYARVNGVLGYVRFGRVVTRLRKDIRGGDGGGGEWVVRSRRVGGLGKDDGDAGLRESGRGRGGMGGNGHGHGNGDHNNNDYNGNGNKINEDHDADDAEDEHEERFDYISIANGHYEKVMIPEIPGLDRFEGTILHSRWYRRPEEYIGRRVLVVGSFASGSDVARELASVQIPTPDLPESMRLARKRNHEEHPDVPSEGTVEVFQSSSMLPNDMSSYGKKVEEGQPWTEFIQHRPLIERVDEGVVYFKDGSTLTGVDVIIFATGYYYHLPFCKAEDHPWDEKRVCEEKTSDVDVLDETGGWDKGGIQGLAMQNLDELKLFLKGDRSCAFIALPYLVVPFPLAEIQSHLTALYWAGRLPDLPESFSLPPRPDAEQPPVNDKQPDHVAQQAGNDTTHDNEHAQPGKPPVKKDKRHTEKVRGDLVFGFPFEFDYENYVLGLTSQADGGRENGWGAVEDWRYPLRKNKALRSETLGY